MRVAVVLFTRDLRVHDNPALAAAHETAECVVPLFVVDPTLPAHPNRRRFLAESLADLRQSLRDRGADLLVRRGDPVAETMRVAREVDAAMIAATADVSRYATGRQRRLADACAAERTELRLCDGVTIVPATALKPAGGGDHYRVFTPYWRAWERHPRRASAVTPRRLALPDGMSGSDPAAVLGEVTGGSPDVVPGGESEARRRLRNWRARAGAYAEQHDDLAADNTSRLSAYLHFGCVSPLAVESAAAGSPEFVRQLCWRDFHHQVLRAFPALTHRAYRRAAADRWRTDDDALAAWKQGRTGVPVVDAGMRQLAAQGYLHNRARLITAAYLTRQLGLDWRAGAAWYAALLADADVANNWGNWQWVAGTGNDTRPNRRFNPVRQAHRFDPDGRYVRRWVPELAGVPGGAVHEPWRLPAAARRCLDYPDPLTLDTWDDK